VDLDSREARLQLRIDARERLRARCEDLPGPFYNRLTRCGEIMNLACTGCGDSRPVAKRCNWKCCPVCQYAITAASADRFARIAKNCQWPLLVTFNAEHKADEGVLAFRQMREAHTRLRAQVWWKRRVRGGVACWEVSRLNKAERKRKRLGKDKGWHFHCHCLLDCRWLYATTPPPRPGASDEERASRIRAINEEIAQLWTDTMGGRKGSISVRRVWHDKNGGIDGAVHEVCKYAMSGADLADSEYDIEPVLWALEKTRMIVPFGTFFGHPGIKRRAGAPAMCPCGCSDWMPDFMVDRFFRR